MTTYPENFADYPKSVSEIKSDENGGNAALVTPRDALICALRRIDSAETKPETLIIVWGGKSEGRYDTSYEISSPDPRFTVAALVHVQHKLMG